MAEYNREYTHYLRYSHVGAVILAGGEGKRMHSDLPKVMHKIAGKPLLDYSLTTLVDMGFAQTVVVVKYKHQIVEDYVHTHFLVDTVLQNEAYGTGAALVSVLPVFDKAISAIVCLYGDNAMFVHKETYQRLLALHTEKRAILTFATREIDNPTKQGRIIRDATGNVAGIVEMKGATPQQLLIKEVNPGLYVFDRTWLEKNSKQLKPSSITGEYYVTDFIAIALSQNQKVQAINFGQSNEWRGVTTQEDLKKIEDIIDTQ